MPRITRNYLRDLIKKEQQEREAVEKLIKESKEIKEKQENLKINEPQRTEISESDKGD